MTIVDTAGLRAATLDPIEREGIARAGAARDVAHVVIVVLDRSRPLDDDDRALLGGDGDAARGWSSRTRATSRRRGSVDVGDARLVLRLREERRWRG